MLDIIREKSQSWVVKIIFGIIILVFVFWGVGSFNAQNPEIIVTVNGENITRSDFIIEFESYVANAKRNMPDIPDTYFQSDEQIKRVLAFMVDKELLAQAAQNMGMTISVAEVQREILNMPTFKDQNGQFSLEIYDVGLKRRKIKKSEFEEQVRMALLLSKMQNLIMSVAHVSEEEALANFRHYQETRKVDYVFFENLDFFDQVEISDGQVAEYYELNKAMFNVPRHIDVEYLVINPQALATRYEVADEQIQEYYETNKVRFIEIPQVKIRHILLAIPGGATADELELIKQKAESVYKQAEKGADFSELARENSNDSTAANGGEMGWVSLNDMMPIFVDRLKTLESGEITAPFVSNMGYHIMKVEGRKEERQMLLPEVREQIEMLITAEKGTQDMPDILDKVVGDILNGTDIVVIAKELGLTTTQAESLVRDEVVRHLGIGPEAVESLFLTPEGITVDRPIASGSGYIFVKITRVQEAHIAPLEDVKEQIVAVLKEQESQALATLSATEVGKALKAGNNLPSGVQSKVSNFFARQAGPKEFGSAPAFVEAIFAQQSKDEWVGPYTTALGSVVAKLNEVEYPSAEDWQKVKDIVIMQITMFKQEGLLESYLRELQATADISNDNSAILQFDN